MKPEASAHEFALLRFSLGMGVFFTVLGIGWGVAIQSSVVLFDGIYSGMSIILTTLSLLAARILSQPDDETFQFGRGAFEPMVVALKSVVMISVCLYGIVSSTLSILAGGATENNSGGGILYGLVSISACLFSWVYLRRHSAGMPDLVQAESEQWMLDTVLSAAVMLSFILSFFLEGTRHAALVPYIDPGMVVLGSCYFIRLPLRRCLDSLRELLMVAPADNIQQYLQAQADAVAKENQFLEAIVRSTKIGRELAVDVVFIVRPDSPPTPISALDEIRQETRERLASLDLELWLNILFTADRRWA